MAAAVAEVTGSLDGSSTTVQDAGGRSKEYHGVDSPRVMDAAPQQDKWHKRT